ncbi:MAG: TlpA disulfide reductase family protein [Myxococcota bacterium]
MAGSAVFAAALLGALAAPAGEWAEDRARAAIVSAAEVGLRAPACELVPLSAAAEAAGGEPVSPYAAGARGREAGEGGDAKAAADAVVRRFEGRVTLVDFWASWCPTCEHAFAGLDAVARAHRAEGLDVVAINLDADAQDARDFLAGRDLAFEVLRDETGRCPRGFGLVGMPQAFLIDASGRVRAVTRGFREGEAKAMREQIEALLAGAPGALPAVAAGPGADGESAVAPASAPSSVAR